MPAGLVDQEDGVGAGRDDLGEVASVLQAGGIRAAPLPSFGQTAPKM
jgi:hypothetical protein